MEIKDRISQIIKENGLTSQQFGEMIDIQPSSLSHISAGRNQPSLKVIMNILDKFPDISSDWLISGKGNMYRIDNENDELDSDEESIALPKVVREVVDEVTTPIFTDVTGNNEKLPIHTEYTPINEVILPMSTSTPHSVEDKNIESDSELATQIGDLPIVNKVKKIVIFYEDNTFEEFTSR